VAHQSARDCGTDLWMDTAAGGSRLVIGMVVAAACALGGCDISSPSDAYESTIVSHGDTAETSVPDTVSAGQAFEASVEAFGSGCTLPDHTDVARSYNLAVVRPYDRYSGNPNCPDILIRVPHTTTIVVPFRGRAVIRFVGRAMPTGERVVLERGLEVVP